MFFCSMCTRYRSGQKHRGGAGLLLEELPKSGPSLCALTADWVRHSNNAIKACVRCERFKDGVNEEEVICGGS